MNQRRREITDTARRLFGQRGYNAVSMRDIADALGISVGNLTYYFRRKEDLIETVVMEDYQNFRRGEPPESLEELERLFAQFLERQRQRSYYFRHHVQLSQLCPRVYQFQVSMLNSLRQTLDVSFRRLEEKGLMSSPFYPGHREDLLQALSTVYLYGAPIAERIGAEAVSEAVERSLWSVIVPCLTERGREEFARMKKK